jgi:hypothetical protein
VEQRRFDEGPAGEDGDEQPVEDERQQRKTEHRVHDRGVDAVAPRDGRPADFGYGLGNLHRASMALGRDDLRPAVAARRLERRRQLVDRESRLRGMACGPRLEPRVPFEELQRGEPGRNPGRKLAPGERDDDGVDDGVDDALDISEEASLGIGPPQTAEIDANARTPSCGAPIVSTTGTPSTPARSVDPDALPFRFVAHVEADDHRASELKEFERELETSTHERGIEDVDDGVDGRAQEDIPGVNLRLVERG